MTMRIKVEFTANIPDDAPMDQIQEWLEFKLRVFASLKLPPDSPLLGKDFEGISVDWIEETS